MKLLNEPPFTVISPTANPVAASFAVNVRLIVESLVVEPLLTPEVVYVIAIVGATLSYVQVNCAAALLLLPAASVNVPPATSPVVAFAPDGVKVAV